ncbi:type 1 phosphatases regulator YPI1 [Scheffersomyces xylosifermentans]|uniref:type 1 phosphatases regulator YPI1 n=1 Tax=Scheffersomyces xylosifermentans TaxID=1304137 RepID=UPI00315D63AB
MSNRASHTVVTGPSQANPGATEQQSVLCLRRQSVLERDDGATQEKTKKKKKKKAKVQWTEDVIDNEDMGKKKTKICCIFHPQRNFDEGTDSDHSHSSSSDESDQSGDEGGTNDKLGTKKDPVKGPKKEVSPNAYEHQPHYKNESKLPDGAS